MSILFCIFWFRYISLLTHVLNWQDDQVPSTSTLPANKTVVTGSITVKREMLADDTNAETNRTSTSTANNNNSLLMVAGPPPSSTINKMAYAKMPVPFVAPIKKEMQSTEEQQPNEASTAKHTMRYAESAFGKGLLVSLNPLPVAIAGAGAPQLTPSAGYRVVPSLNPVATAPKIRNKRKGGDKLIGDSKRKK